MEFLNDYWGVNDQITVAEISARALVMFLITLALVRFSGMRPFGKGDAFDSIITILLGGVLSRGVVGATPFFSAVAGGLVILLVHKAFGKIAFRNKTFETLTKGKTLILYSDENFVRKNMQKANITERDIEEELRLKLHTASLKTIEKVFIEKTGEISFIERKQD